MTLATAPLLFVAALIAGALNSVAGGGSFLSFPAVIFTGVPPVNANATNTVALWPGSVASVGAYRVELARQDRASVVWLATFSAIGGVLGALLLLNTPQTTFMRLIPYLLLLATLLFAFSGNIISWVRARYAPSGKHRRTSFVAVSLLQLVISVYGGYFGAGIGIMMLAALGLMGMENIHEMNALKTLLASFINGVAVITFIAAGAVFWHEAILMLVAAVIGGYGGAFYARKLDPLLVRRFVILVGVAMTIYFFVRS